MRLCVVTMTLFTLILISANATTYVTGGEITQRDQWVREHLSDATHLPPFSFTYADQPSSQFLLSWLRSEVDSTPDGNRKQEVISWTSNGLQIRCVAEEYRDYPVVEWTVYFKNIGSHNTAILQNIQGLDTTLSRSNGPEFVLNGLHGDSCVAESYEPYRITLGPDSTNTFGPPESGKSCDGPKGWPYYNLQMPGGGWIMAIGWPGQWASSFVRDAADDLQIQAGQQLTHLYLKPGEQIRTPLILLMFWKGTNIVHAQNTWRHFYVDHILPRVDGRLPSPMSQIQVGGGAADTNTVNAFLADGIRPDLCWRDAGGAGTWYVHGTNSPYKGGDAWLNTGTWEINTNMYPDGFRPFVNWIHSQGMEFILWFEPERVGDPDSWLERHHSNWILPGTASTVGDILNEGDPEVFHWLTNHIEHLIKANGLDWYREDMNGNGPLPAWRNHDTMDRQGITENFYVQGHLAYWDALLAMNPGLRIDSCASGGRRNDLETMLRAVPLLRSDFQWPGMANLVSGNQCQTYGLSFWLPYQGTGCYLYDPYSFRSFYMASFGMGSLTATNAAAQRQAYAECKKIGPMMIFGDYYPLTAYSLADNIWMAWEFNRPVTGEGCVQIFRRKHSSISSMTFKLHGLKPDKRYEVQDFDKGDLGWQSGKELMTDGVKIDLKPRQSAILYYSTSRIINQNSKQ